MKEEYTLVHKLEGKIIDETELNRYEYMQAVNLNKRLRNKSNKP